MPPETQKPNIKSEHETEGPSSERSEEPRFVEVIIIYAEATVFEEKRIVPSIREQDCV